MKGRTSPTAVLVIILVIAAAGYGVYYLLQRQNLKLAEARVLDFKQMAGDYTDHIRIEYELENKADVNVDVAYEVLATTEPGGEGEVLQTEVRGNPLLANQTKKFVGQNSFAMFMGSADRAKLVKGIRIQLTSVKKLR